MPQFSAASTAARISGSVYWVDSIGLYGELTPPPAISLIWLAPCRSCSRARSRTSSGLSAMAAMPSSSEWLSGPPGSRGSSNRKRKSPWPDVCEIIAPDG